MSERPSDPPVAPIRRGPPPGSAEEDIVELTGLPRQHGARTHLYQDPSMTHFLDFYTRDVVGWERRGRPDVGNVTVLIPRDAPVEEVRTVPTAVDWTSKEPRPDYSYRMREDELRCASYRWLTDDLADQAAEARNRGDERAADKFCAQREALMREGRAQVGCTFYVNPDCDHVA